MTTHEAVKKLPDGRVAVWSVERIWQLARDLPIVEMDLSQHPALNSHAWGANLTVSEVIDHTNRILGAKMEYPIILAADGRFFDGLHRTAKALLMGKATRMQVQQFTTDPEPDRYEDAPE